MAIKVRMRDIPFEQMMKCITDHDPDKDANRRARWAALQGTWIWIMGPPVTRDQLDGAMVCEGPFFPVVFEDGEMRGYALCAHWAEIGD